jgi:hypothetical protein
VLSARPTTGNALLAIAAMQAGADLYCQKPISHTFLEGEAMVKTARKLGRVVQSARSDGARRTSRRRASSCAKATSAAWAWCARTATCACAATTTRPTTAAANLDFEMWTGPAPMRPYSPILHPSAALLPGVLERHPGRHGIHMLDLARWFLDLKWPKARVVDGRHLRGEGRKANVPDTQTVHYDFGDVTVVWEAPHVRATRLSR